MNHWLHLLLHLAARSVKLGGMATIEKALCLLDLFTPARPLLGLTEVQRLTGRDKATVFRHLDALSALGFLEQDRKTRAYCLGPALTRLANMRAATVSDADTLAPIVDGIAEQTGELVHIARMSGDTLVTVYQADCGRHAVRVTLLPTETLPSETTSSGRAIRAFGGAPELSKVRARGYARADDSFEAGVSSIGVPIFDAQGRAQMACSVAFPTVRGTRAHRDMCRTALLRAAPQLTLRAGGIVPEPIAALWRAHTEHLQEA